MNKVEKILFSLIFTFVIIYTCDRIIAKDLEISVAIDNGDYIEYDEITGIPFAEDGRTLVPLRKTMEELGVEVEWNQEEQQAELYQNDITVIVPLDEKYILVNDEEIEIDKEATVVNERIYLPIRFVCEGFGYQVGWNQDAHVVEITTEEEIEDDIPKALDEDTNAQIAEGVTSVNIRNSKGGEVYKQVDYPTRLKIVKQSGSWYQIEYDDEIRYITANKNYIVVDDGVKIEKEVFDYGKVVTWDDVTVDCQGTRWQYALTNSDDLNDEIYQVANEYGIEPVLVKLIVAWESNGHLKEAYCMDKNGNEFYGLMQVHYGNRNMKALVHNDYPRMLTDVVYSIQAGCDMLLVHSNNGTLSMYQTMQVYGSTYKNSKNLIYQLYEQLSGKSIYDSIMIDSPRTNVEEVKDDSTLVENDEDTIDEEESQQEEIEEVEEVEEIEEIIEDNNEENIEVEE